MGQYYAHRTKLANSCLSIPIKRPPDHFAQAQYETRLAGRDCLNAEDANRAAQKRAEELRRQAEAAKKALDAAKVMEAAARKAYENALNAVDRLQHKPQK